MAERYEIQGWRFEDVWRELKTYENFSDAMDGWLWHLQNKTSYAISRYNALRLARLTTAYVDETWRIKEILEYRDLEEG